MTRAKRKPRAKPLIVLGCDSGSRSAGFSIVRDGVPVYASAVGLSGEFAQIDYLRIQIELARAKTHRPTLVCVEYPRVWGRSRYGRRIDANALIRVALGAGVIGALCQAHGLPCPVYVLPGEWTAKIPKDDRHAVLYADHGDELPGWLYPTPPALQEHALDALGIALWAYKMRAADA